MASLTVTRTLVGSIQNQKQVGDELDSLGIAASKLWNVARWTIDRIRDETGNTPGDDVLKSYLKNHDRYRDLHAQSSQRVIEELAEAFQSWFTSVKDNPDANPPGYRKYGETHPYSTVTFKQTGFKCDPEHNRVRLSKGRNLKDHFSDFILCEYDLRPGVSLSDVERIQQVRAVHTGSKWEVHFVCKIEKTVESAGERSAGVFLGGTNTAAVAFEDEYIVYPGNRIKQDRYYFRHLSGDAPSQRRQKDDLLTRRQQHFYHTLASTIIEECVDREVGTLRVAWVVKKPSSETHSAKTHARTERLEQMFHFLKYKGRVRGVDIIKEEGMDSPDCSECGDTSATSSDEGLFVCQACGIVANADCNRAATVRQSITPSPSKEDRSNGCVAQPSVHLFDQTRGEFIPRTQGVPYSGNIPHYGRP